MIYAFVTTTADLVEHSSSDRGQFYMILSLNNDSSIVFDEEEDGDLYLAHGWILWFAWGVLGFI